MRNEQENAAWRDQCRRQLERDVVTRIKYGFCHVHKPVLDDAPVRAFATMAEFRRWCDRALPRLPGISSRSERETKSVPERKLTAEKRKSWRPPLRGDNLGALGRRQAIWL